jgi:hypothetical protein
MTRNRSWLALGALLVALAGGALWAADQEKKAGQAPAPKCCAEKACCADKCCTQEKGCCEAKCCAQEKAKSCCADGKCCGCCDKAQRTATLPVPPGSAIQVMIAPPGAFGEEGCADWVGPLAPPPAPVCQPAPPMPFAPVNQYYSAPCVAPPPPPVAASTWGSPWGGGRPTPWRVCVVQENGKSCLGMQVGVSKDTAAVCEGMTLKVGGELKLSVVGKQVQVSGKCVNATADSVCWSAENGEIMLDGSVKVSYHGDAHKAEITAEQVVVSVPDGRIEVMGARSLAPQSSPVSTGCPSTTSPTRCPACPRPTTECQQLFNFWTGFFH